MLIDSGHFPAPGLSGETDAHRDISLPHNSPMLADVLAEGAARFGDAPLTIQSALHGGVATLASLHRQSLALAGALHALGLRQGDVVAIQTPVWLEQALMIRAVAALGGAILPVSEHCLPAETGRLLRDARATALVTPDRLQDIGCADRLAAMGRMPALQTLVVIGNDAPAGAVRWKDLLRQATPDFPAPVQRADDPTDIAALAFTAESAAAPTSALLSSRALLADLAAGRGTRDATALTLSLWPSGSMAGLIALLRHGVDGTPTILMESPDPAEAARLIERHRIAAVYGAPFCFNALLDAAAAQGQDLGSLREFQAGAAPVPSALAARCAELGLRVASDGLGK